MRILNGTQSIDIKDKNVAETFVMNKNKTANNHNQNNLINKFKTYRLFCKLNFTE